MSRRLAFVGFLAVAGCGAPDEDLASATVTVDGGVTQRPVYVRFVLPTIPDDAPVRSVVLGVHGADDAPLTALVGPRPPDAAIVADPDVAFAAEGVTVVGVGRVEVGGQPADAGVFRSVDPFLRERGGTYLWDGLPLYVTLMGTTEPVPQTDVSLELTVRCSDCLDGVEAAVWRQP